MTRSYTIPRNFWRVVRRILGHRTYTCCQLSYDVGQRASIVARNRAWNGPLILVLYAKSNTLHVGDERGRLALRIRREKLYENRLYVRAWLGNRVDPAAGGKRPDPAAPPSAVVALDRGPGQRRVAYPGSVGSRRRRLAPARRNHFVVTRDRSICGRSRPSGNPRGSASTYTSRARTPVGRSGTPPCRIRT